MVAVAVSVQPEAELSVTVTLYVPAGRPLTIAVLAAPASSHT